MQSKRRAGPLYVCKDDCRVILVLIFLSSAFIMPAGFHSDFDANIAFFANGTYHLQ
jgi:hypothetical protein